MIDDLRAAVREDAPRFRAELESLVRIPSVSAKGFDPAEVHRSARAVAECLENAGLTGVRFLEVDGAHPAVFGEIPAPPGAPTVLLYAHHDVQPPGPESEWTSPPFEPEERDGRLYGRGSSDDKSGLVTHAAVVRAFVGGLPVGVKVFAEGGEEVGSTHLVEFLSTYDHLFGADAIVIADTGNWKTGRPALTTSLRGLVDCVVEVRTLDAAVHSGMYGGAIPDALTTLSKIIASLHDADGEVAVPGLVTGHASSPDRSEEELRSQAGAVPGLGMIGSGDLNSRMWRKPAISVLAVDAPAIRDAINQLVPVARAKVSLRIAPGDDPARAATALEDHLIASAPWGAAVTVTPGAQGDAFDLDTSGPLYDAYRLALAEAYGTEAVEVGEGGSIPFVAAFRETHPHAGIVLTGAADPSSSAHGPNESVDLADLQSAILAEAIALHRLAG